MKILKYAVPYVFISSFNYYFAQESVLNSSPITFNLIRYLISSAIFLSLTRKIIFNKDVFQLSIYTVTSSVLWAYGLVYVSPAESAVLSYTMPLFSIPISFLVLSERVTNLEILGVVVGFSGVVLYGLPLIHGFTLFGAVLTIINAVFWALFSTFYRKLKDYDPLTLNTSQFVLGSGLLTLLLPLDYKIDFDSQFFYGILYTSTLGGAIAFFLWNLMLRVEKVSKVTVLSFSVPILATLIEFVVFGNPPLSIQFLGISLMFVGILLSRLKDFHLKGVGIKQKRIKSFS